MAYHTPLGQASDEELLELLRAAEARQSAEYAHSLEVVHELDRRGVAGSLGFPDTARLLRHLLHVSRREAGVRVAMAEAVVPDESGTAVLAATGAAMRLGTANVEQAKAIHHVLSQTREEVPDEEIVEAERALLTLARDADPPALRRVGLRTVRQLNEAVVGPAAQERAEAEPLRYASYHRTRDGRFKLITLFDAAAGDRAATYLDLMAKPHPSTEDGPDLRSLGRRQGEAMLDLFESAYNGEDHTCGTNPDTAIITIPLTELEQRAAEATLHCEGSFSSPEAPAGSSALCPNPLGPFRSTTSPIPTHARKLFHTNDSVVPDVTAATQPIIPAQPRSSDPVDLDKATDPSCATSPSAAPRRRTPQHARNSHVPNPAPETPGTKLPQSEPPLTQAPGTQNPKTPPARAQKEATEKSDVPGAFHLRESASAPELNGVPALLRLTCDARLIPAVLGTTGEVLHLGRSARHATRAQRRALALRDKGCTFPGCTRSPRFTTPHHIRHWAHGGNTDLANLILLCEHHHRTIHHTDWQVRMHHGVAQFIPPSWLDPSRTPRRNTAHHQPLERIHRAWHTNRRTHSVQSHWRYVHPAPTWNPRR